MSAPMTLSVLLATARNRLKAAGIDTAAIDARLLVEAATGLGRLDLLTGADRIVPDDAVGRLDGWIVRRTKGEPVGRILGTASFFGLDFTLGPDTLEPRPDTEVLVDVAVGAVRKGLIPGAAPDGTGLRLLDIGTGTGAIAVTLLHKLPAATGLATDLAPGAIETARNNAARHGVAGRLTFATGSYFEPVEGRFALIVSNPPYIVSAVIAGLDPEVRLHDPLLALDGGADGLDAYRAIVNGAARHLEPGGMLAVEIGYDQGDAVRRLFAAADFTAIEVQRDLGGRDRVVSGRLAGKAVEIRQLS